jgi:hypothetical protein
MAKPRKMRWTGHVVRVGRGRRKRNLYRLVRKSEGNRPLGRRRRRSVDNIKMKFGEVGWDGMDWIGLSRGRNQKRHLGKFSSSCTTGGLSRSTQLLGVSLFYIFVTGLY